MIISMDFLEAIKRNVENRVLVCFKAVDVYFPAVFMVGKNSRNDHVAGPRYNCTIIFEGKSKLKFIFLNLVS